MGLWYPLCPLVTTSSNGITHHYQWYPHKIDGFLPRPYRYVLNPHESPVTSINWSSIMDHSHHSPFPITCVPLLHWLNPHSWIIHIPVRTKNLFPCWFSTPAFWGTKPPKKIHPSPVCDTTASCRWGKSLSNFSSSRHRRSRSSTDSWKKFRKKWENKGGSH